MAAAAATIRDGADGNDDARSDETEIEPVNKQVIVKDAEPTHCQNEEDSAYLRRKMRLLEREVSRLQETVERLTKERTERTAQGLNNDGEGQEVGITSARGTKGNAPGARTGTIIGPPPQLPHTPGQHRAFSAVPTG